MSAEGSRFICRARIRNSFLHTRSVKYWNYTCCTLHRNLKGLSIVACYSEFCVPVKYEGRDR